jgi:hypothetical protein
MHRLSMNSARGLVLQDGDLKLTKCRKTNGIA